MTAATRLVVTVDTEPDDQWEPASGGRLPPLRFANTRGLDRLKHHLHEAGVPVTWMTSYAIARDEPSATVLRRAAAEGDEIAGHLHGWETPPFVEADRAFRPFIYEYADEVRLAKHRCLVAAHEDAFGVRPVSYRAGRWGLDALELEHLALLGYRIDSSVPPGIDFRDRCGLAAPGPDFRAHLRPGAPLPYRIGSLWEVPVSITPAGLLGTGVVGSTVGRLAGARGPGTTASRWAYRTLDGLGLHRLVWIRPLKHPRRHLVAAASELVRRGAPVLNVMLHSSEAFAGTSPLSRTEGDVDRLLGDLRAIVRAALEAGAVASTLRNALAGMPKADARTVASSTEPGV